MNFGSVNWIGSGRKRMW